MSGWRGRFLPSSSLHNNEMAAGTRKHVGAGNSSSSAGFAPSLSKLRFGRCGIAYGSAACPAERLRLSTFYQTGFPPRESVGPETHPPVGRRATRPTDRRIHAAENHNISENSAGKAEPFHKAGGEALSRSADLDRPGFAPALEPRCDCFERRGECPVREKPTVKKALTVAAILRSHTLLVLDHAGMAPWRLRV